MKKKIWAAALICIIVLGMLDGCGPKEKDADKEAAGNTETEAVEGIHATETETEAIISLIVYSVTEKVS